MKIIHCADIHLDSALDSNLGAEQAQERSAELCDTFGRLVDYAVAHEVRAVLIAGDLFDTCHASPRTAGFVLERIRGAEQVDFLYLRGNHEGGRDVFSGMEIPDNLKTFGTGWRSFRYGDVVISGMEPEGDGWFTMYDSLNLRAEDINIVMLHGQVSTQPGRELIALPRLRDRKIRYLALGHIHSYRQLPLGDGGVCCYCGCLEGRGFDECGGKGFVLLEAGEGQVVSEFVPFASRTLREVAVDISGLQSVHSIHLAMERESAEIPRKDPVKFILRGEFTPETQKDLTFLRKMLERRFWFVKIRDETRLWIDPESYADDISLKGEFIRVVMATDRPREEKERIILMGLRALRGEEVLP